MVDYRCWHSKYESANLKNKQSAPATANLIYKGKGTGDMSDLEYHESMTPRQKLLLTLVVEHYIRSAEAIGSKTLATMIDNAFSSATIRSELGALDSMGYIKQPHTSAGRVPTLSGYRFYIDNLMREQALTDFERMQINSALQLKGGSIEEIVYKTGQALSNITGHTSIASAPMKDAYLRRIEIFPMTPRGVVVAVMTSSGLIKSRMASLPADVSSGSIYSFLKLVNSYLDGRYLKDITDFDYSVISQAEGNMAFLFSPVLDAINELINEARQAEINIFGESHLIDTSNIDSSVELIKFLTNKGNVAEILKLSGNGTRVIMGRDTGIPQLMNVSLIFCDYKGGQFGDGTVGLIVPPNAEYAKLIPKVNAVAKALQNLIGNYFSI